MSTTPRLELPFLHTQQRQKELTVNESLMLIDSLLNSVLININCSKPNQEVKNGDIYHIHNPTYELWLDHHDYIAIFFDGWRFIKPKNGMLFFVSELNNYYSYINNKWQIFNNQSSQDNTDYPNDSLILYHDSYILKIKPNQIISISLEQSCDVHIISNRDPIKFSLIVETKNHQISFNNHKIITNASSKNLLKESHPNALLIIEAIFYNNNLIIHSISKIQSK